jgi:hypothetical protein
MIAVTGQFFRAVVQRVNLERECEKHTIFRIRQASFIYRLLVGDAGTFELNINARTSEAMIDKRYASRLTPMMVVESIHSLCIVLIISVFLL